MDEHSNFYTGVNKAYDFFNRVLFDNELPQVVITLQSSNKFAGYHHAEHFINRDSERVDEICLNPDLFLKRTNEECLSTLVHEMVHQWQTHFGKATRNGYHNKQWAAKMVAIGLEPFSTTNPSKQVGQKVSHTIVKGGAYQKAYSDFRSHHDFINFQALPVEKKKAKAKVKNVYECPSCGNKLWGKPSIHIMCIDCDEIYNDITPAQDEE